jgi:hypothetical protein
MLLGVNNDLLCCLAVAQALHSRFLSSPLGPRQQGGRNEYEISYSTLLSYLHMYGYDYDAIYSTTARNCGRLLETSERPTSFNLNRGGLVGAGGPVETPMHMLYFT